MLCLGAVYCYYESRRRLHNDRKPERQEQVAKNKNALQKYLRKKRVCCLAVVNHIILDTVHMISYIYVAS